MSGSSGERRPLLDIDDLRVSFGSKRQVHAVLGASLHVGVGERVGLIGESGSGKSVTAMSVLRLFESSEATVGPTSSIRFGDVEVLDLDEDALRAYRGSGVGMIFQNPMSSLNPTRRIGRQIAGLLERLDSVPSQEAERRTLDLLGEVGLPDPISAFRSYPHQLSGGMRQRVLIAMVLAREPQIVIADEPTSALDVTVQAAILDMLRVRTQERGISVLMITHDLGVVAQFCDRVYVMYGGRIVEEGRTADVLRAPAHPYSRALAACVPTIDGPLHQRLPMIPGRQSTRREVGGSCSFAERCEFVTDECQAAVPQLLPVTATRTSSACFRTDEIVAGGLP